MLHSTVTSTANAKNTILFDSCFKCGLLTKQHIQTSDCSDSVKRQDTSLLTRILIAVSKPADESQRLEFICEHCIEAVAFLTNPRCITAAGDAGEAGHAGV